VLLSGGIDSPVASYYAMKRGLELVYLHVHGFQNSEAKELSKIHDSVRALSGYSGAPKLFLAPYHIFQGCSLGSNRYELVLFKRFLYKLAENVAEQEHADCIVTGESLGQVASQTIKNLSASSTGIGTFVFRPLIGMDKQEIVDMAKRMGTFDISSRPYKDVCSINAQRTELAADSNSLDKLYSRLHVDEAVEKTLKKLKLVEVG
jgi:thiamine biosynthesis protein ThiI